MVISATDVPDDTSTATTSWKIEGESFIAGLPAGLSIGPTGDQPCRPTCNWTMSGIADASEGAYVIKVTVEDDDGGADFVEIEIVAASEDASLAFDGGNPVSVPVASEGGNSGTFALRVLIKETVADLPEATALPGDISKAVISMTLQPVGPGGPMLGVCVPEGVNGTTGYDTELQVTCPFDDVSVNAYSAQVVVDGSYYAGSGEDVLVV